MDADAAADVEPDSEILRSLPDEEAQPDPGADTGLPMVWRKLVTVAWASIGIGLGIEILLLIAAELTTGMPKAAAVIADLVQKISWSFVVCVGIALGTAAARAVRHLVMGALGFLFAPLAFTAAKSLHKSVLQALGVAGAAAGVSPFLIASLKAVEYAVLGFLLGRLARSERSLGAYLGVGAVVGVVFGAVITTVLAEGSAQAPTVANVLPKAINEMIFPLGCSLVFFAAETLARHTKA